MTTTHLCVGDDWPFYYSFLPSYRSIERTGLACYSIAAHCCRTLLLSCYIYTSVCRPLFIHSFIRSFVHLFVCSLFCYILYAMKEVKSARHWPSARACSWWPRYLRLRCAFSRLLAAALKRSVVAIAKLQIHPRTYCPVCPSSFILLLLLLLPNKCNSDLCLHIPLLSSSTTKCSAHFYSSSSRSMSN